MMNRYIANSFDGEKIGRHNLHFDYMTKIFGGLGKRFDIIAWDLKKNNAALLQGARHQTACIAMCWRGARLYRSFENNPYMKVVSMAKTNTQEMFVENLFKDVFQNKVMAEYDQNQQAFEKLVGADDAY